MTRELFAIAVHGGAGAIPRSAMTGELEAEYRSGLRAALQIGHSILSSGGSALDAVEAAVVCLENNILFNAGRGSVFNHAGTHEMDASIMRGDTLQAGAVAGVSGVQNPIALARAVMEAVLYPTATQNQPGRKKERRCIEQVVSESSQAASDGLRQLAVAVAFLEWPAKVTSRCEVHVFEYPYLPARLTAA